MECRPHRRGLTRPTQFQALPVRGRLRGSRDERSLLSCGRARARRVFKESSRIRLELFCLTRNAVSNHVRLLHQHSFHVSSEPACATGSCQRRRIANRRRPKQISAPSTAANVGAMSNWWPTTTTTAPASAATA